MPDDNGGHEPFTMDWFKYQAERIAYLYERVDANEAAARLYLIAEQYAARKIK